MINQTTHPMESAEIDQLCLDILVVDKQDHLVIGRPTLTFAADVCTGYPLGYSITFEPPKHYAVMKCLYHAITPKPNVKALYGTKHDWTAQGIPSSLVIDNGKQYIGRDFTDICIALGITLKYPPIHASACTGIIEGLVKTVRENVDHCPLKKMSSNSEPLDLHKSHKGISLIELEKMIHVALIDIYAETHQKRINGSPARCWEESIANHFCPRITNDNDILQLFLGRTDHRQISRQGIKLNGIWYNNGEMADLRENAPAGRVKVKHFCEVEELPGTNDARPPPSK